MIFLRIFLFFCCFCLVKCILAQDFEKRVGFLNYLINKELYNEAILESELIKKQLNNDSEQKEILNILIAKSYFHIDKDSALYYLDKIKQIEHKYYNYSKLLSSYLYLLDKENEKATIELLKVQNMDTSENCIYDLLNKSILTIENKTKDSIRLVCSGLFYQERVINENQEKLKSIKNKSRLIAGVMSGLVPGLGKIYVGKKKEGISNFLIISLLGYQAYEGYRIGGKKDLRFITFSSLFSVFYIGNIWGSTLSVQIKKQETYEEVYNNISVALTVPVDKLFKSK